MKSLPIRAVLILLVSIAGLLVALVGAIYALGLFIESIAVSATPNPVSVRIALSCVFVVFALALYTAKNSRLQFLYGLLEIAVGLVANWRSLDSWFQPVGGQSLPDVMWARLLLIGAGTYAIGRGHLECRGGLCKILPEAVAFIEDELAPIEDSRHVCRGVSNGESQCPDGKATVSYLAA